METVLVNPVRSKASRQAAAKKAAATRKRNARNALVAAAGGAKPPAPRRRARRNPVRKSPGIDAKKTGANLAGAVGAAALKLYVLEDQKLLGIEVAGKDMQLALISGAALAFTKGTLGEVAQGALSYAVGSWAHDKMQEEWPPATGALYRASTAPAHVRGAQYARLGGPAPVRRGQTQSTAGLFVVSEY